MNDKILSMIGLACKAGKVTGGEDTLRSLMRSGKVKLLIIAKDASDNTKKRFENGAQYYKIDYIYFGSKELLGMHTGKSSRAVIGVTDTNFKESIMSLIKKTDQT